MHELAVCQSVVDHVVEIAARHGHRPVIRISLSIGPLAGVEPALLRSAFPLMAAGTLCADASIDIEEAQVRVHCAGCSTTSDARSNRLLCAGCGAWRVTLVSGAEMTLTGVSFQAAGYFDPPIHQGRETIHV